MSMSVKLNTARLADAGKPMLVMRVEAYVNIGLSLHVSGAGAGGWVPVSSSGALARAFSEVKMASPMAVDSDSWRFCTAVRAADVDYIWAPHVKLGLKAGAREEAFHAIDTLGPLDKLTPDEALIIRFGRELLETRKVSDATFNAAVKMFGEQGVKLDVSFADSESKPENGRIAAERLIRDGCSVVVGAWDSGATISAAQACEAAKVPLVVNVGSARQMRNRKFRMISLPRTVCATSGWNCTP